MIPDLRQTFCQTFRLDDGTRVIIRPIRPEDAEIEAQFVRLLSSESRYLRFMHSVRELTPALLHRLTHPDWPREAALIATLEGPEGGIEIGVARYAPAASEGQVEFAIVVADEWQGRGIATQLMQCLVRLAGHYGAREMVGLTLAENRRMLDFAAALGFDQAPCPDDPSLVTLRRLLRA